ncbi:Olfactory Receptor 7A10 [Manis pentadactyla]|nr:Olfactory Receptor 7A10 [Manis pentadactyla]
MKGFIIWETTVYIVEATAAFLEVSVNAERHDNLKSFTFVQCEILYQPKRLYISSLILYSFFCFRYLITVIGNLLILLAINSNSHLHTPMYFFLSNLSFVDICFTSTIIPKMLNIQTQRKVIAYAIWIMQMCLFIIFSGLGIYLLFVMTYECYVAICYPLNYIVIIDHWLCGLLFLMSWITSAPHYVL